MTKENSETILLDQNMRCSTTEANTILRLDYWRIFCLLGSQARGSDKYYLQKRKSKVLAWSSKSGHANEGTEIVAVADTREEAVILLGRKLDDK